MRFMLVRFVWLLCIAVTCLLAESPCVHAQFEYKQLYEWLYRPPYYARKLGKIVGYYAAPFTQYDALRKRTFISGDAYDVHYTTDQGRTWTPMFDTLMWYLDLGNAMQINRRGTYIWHSTIYDPRNYMNILSEDGGQTWRMAILDTLAGPFGTRDELPGMVVEPSFHVWQGYRALQLVPPNVRGAWVTADNGRTFRRILHHSPALQFTSYQSPADSLLTYIVGNSMFVANVALDSQFRQWAINGLQGNTQWYLLADSSIVGNRGDRIVFGSRPSLGVQQYPSLAVPYTSDSIPFRVSQSLRINDSLVVFISALGGIAAYRVGWEGVRLLMPPLVGSPVYNGPTYGLNDTVLVVMAATIHARPTERAVYRVVDLTTLRVQQFVSDGPTQRLQHGALRYVAPLSSTSWVELNRYNAGVIKVTQDAAKTWRLLDVPNRIDFMPVAYGGVRQIIPRSDGSAMLRTSANSIVVPTDSGYSMPIETAFSWSKDRWRAGLAGAIPGEHLDTDSEYLAPSVRIPFGDQPVVPFDDTSFVTTGGALLRWSNEGRFLDTVFPLVTTHFNRLDNGLWVLGGDSTWFSFNGGKEWVYVSRAFPHRLGRDVGGWGTAPVSASIAANDGTVLLGRRGMQKVHQRVYTDSIHGGLLRSHDLGNTWWQDTSINHRYAVLSLAKARNGTLFCLSTEIVHEPEGKTNGAGRPIDAWWYARTFVHRSTDHGRTWALAITLPYRPTIPQSEPKLVIADDAVYCVQPTAGLFRSTDDGQRWIMMDLKSVPALYQIADVWQPGDGYLYFASDSGYARIHLDNVMRAPVEQHRSEVLGVTITYLPHAHELVLDHDYAFDVEVILCDMQGRSVYHSPRSYEHRHQLPSLPSGAYVAAVRTPQGVTSMPLIITR